MGLVPLPIRTFEWRMILPSNYGTRSAMKNFHLPLPDETYTHLKAAAERSKVPATSLAREAIDCWLRQQLRIARHQAIASFAAETAGTSFDLDPDLEAAGVERLLREEKGAL